MSGHRAWSGLNLSESNATAEDAKDAEGIIFQRFLCVLRVLCGCISRIFQKKRAGHHFEKNGDRPVFIWALLYAEKLNVENQICVRRNYSAGTACSVCEL